MNYPNPATIRAAANRPWPVGTAVGQTYDRIPCGYATDTRAVEIATAADVGALRRQADSSVADDNHIRGRVDKVRALSAAGRHKAPQGPTGPTNPAAIRAAANRPHTWGTAVGFTRAGVVCAVAGPNGVPSNALAHTLSTPMARRIGTPAEWRAFTRAHTLLVPARLDNRCYPEVTFYGGWPHKQTSGGVL